MRDGRKNETGEDDSDEAGRSDPHKEYPLSDSIVNGKLTTGEMQEGTRNLPFEEKSR